MENVYLKRIHSQNEESKNDDMEIISNTSNASNNLIDLNW